MIAGSAIKDFHFFIQWHLTERCNLRCRHCYQERRKVQEMTANEVKREIDGATQMFQAWEEEHGIRVSPSIHFTGGEPFLYKGLWDVIAYSKAKGYGVAMMTNGCLITKDRAKKASSLGISDIQVSLEGPPELQEGDLGLQRQLDRSAGGQRERRLGFEHHCVGIADDRALGDDLDDVLTARAGQLHLA